MTRGVPSILKHVIWASTAIIGPSFGEVRTPLVGMPIHVLSRDLAGVRSMTPADEPFLIVGTYHKVLGIPSVSARIAYAFNLQHDTEHAYHISRIELPKWERSLSCFTPQSALEAGASPSPELLSCYHGTRHHSCRLAGTGRTSQLSLGKTSFSKAFHLSNVLALSMTIDVVPRSCTVMHALHWPAVSRCRRGYGIRVRDFRVPGSLSPW